MSKIGISCNTHVERVVSVLQLISFRSGDVCFQNSSVQFHQSTFTPVAGSNCGHFPEELECAPLNYNFSFFFILSFKHRFRQRLRIKTDIFKTTKSDPDSMETTKKKNFYVLIYCSFNQNRHSLLSNVSCDFGHKCRRLPRRRWRCRRVQGIFAATFFYDPTTS